MQLHCIIIKLFYYIYNNNFLTHRLYWHNAHSELKTKLYIILFYTKLGTILIITHLTKYTFNHYNDNAYMSAFLMIISHNSF